MGHLRSWQRFKRKIPERDAHLSRGGAAGNRARGCPEKGRSTLLGDEADSDPILFSRAHQFTVSNREMSDLKAYLASYKSFMCKMLPIVPDDNAFAEESTSLVIKHNTECLEKLLRNNKLVFIR
jgi:hypothetical protein